MGTSVCMCYVYECLWNTEVQASLALNIKMIMICLIMVTFASDIFVYGTLST